MYENIRGAPCIYDAITCILPSETFWWSVGFLTFYEKSPRYHSGSQLLSHVKVTTTFILYIVQLSSKVYFVEMYFAEVYFQKHRKNCECCHHHSVFKGHNAIVHIVVLNCQKCNQCLKCQVSGHKNFQKI